MIERFEIVCVLIEDCGDDSSESQRVDMNMMGDRAVLNETVVDKGAAVGAAVVVGSHAIATHQIVTAAPRGFDGTLQPRVDRSCVLLLWRSPVGHGGPWRVMFVFVLKDFGSMTSFKTTVIFRMTDRYEKCPSAVSRSRVSHESALNNDVLTDGSSHSPSYCITT